MSSEEEHVITGLLRADLLYVQRRLDEGPNDAVHDSYLFGLADGLIIAASHLGITLRPDLVEDRDEPAVVP